MTITLKVNYDVLPGCASRPVVFRDVVSLHCPRHVLVLHPTLLSNGCTR